MSAGRYEVRPEAMRAAVGNVGGILLQAVNVVLDLESLLVAPSAFGGIGAAVATQNAAMQGQQVVALQSLLGLLEQVNTLVQHSADGYDSADQAISVGYGGRPSSPDPSTNLWHAPIATELATYAMNDSAGSPGEAHSVANVLGYLGRVGMGSIAARPITDVQFAGADGFADWLDADPGNQERLGVIGVYSGAVRDLGDVPGGVHPGDVVVVDSRVPLEGGRHTLGVVGTNGELFNHGQIHPPFTFGADVRVYRPLSAPIPTS